MCPDAPAFGSARLTVVEDDRVRVTQERARVAGYAAGFAAGSRAAAGATETLHARLEAQVRAAEAARLAEHSAAVTVLSRAAQAAGARVVPVLDDARGLLYTGALELARAVLGVELADHARSARAALVRALDVPHDVQVQTVRLHPADLTEIQAAESTRTALAAAPAGSATGADLPAATSTPALPPLDGVRLVADPTLSRGDAVSTFEGGFLDARVETAFARAVEALRTSVELVPTDEPR